MGMKAMPASNVVIETLNLQGILSPEQFLRDRETILHKTFSTAVLMPGTQLGHSCKQLASACLLAIAECTSLPACDLCAGDFVLIQLALQAPSDDVVVSPVPCGTMHMLYHL